MNLNRVMRSWLSAAVAANLVTAVIMKDAEASPRNPKPAILRSGESAVARAYKLSFSFGRKGPVSTAYREQMIFPLSLAFDGSGNVYVINKLDPIIKKFSHSGELLESIDTPYAAFSQTYSGQMHFRLASSPPPAYDPQARNIAVDSTGSLYVTYPFDSRQTIMWMDSQGRDVKAFHLPARPGSAFNPPEGIALASDGSFFVGGIYEDFGGQVYHFKRDGSLLDTIIAPVGEPTLGSIQDIALAKDGSLYVLGDNVVRRISQSGHILNTFGAPGHEEGQFNQAHFIATDNDGHVYVSDSGNRRIQKFTDEGSFISEFGTQRSDPNDRFDPQGLAVDKNGLIYVCNAYTNQVDVFSPARP